MDQKKQKDESIVEEKQRLIFNKTDSTIIF